MLTEEHFIPYGSSNLTGKRVLVLAPHPDDETLGCGGSLALHAAAGDPIKVVFLTNGAKGDMLGRYSRDAYIDLRRKEACSACTCLGVMDVTFWPYEDRELYNADTVISDLITLIDEYHPELIYAPSPQEYHPDHRAAAMFIQDTMKKCETDASLLFYEVNQPIQVSHLVDITPVLDKKIRALQCYRSQLEERPYDDIPLTLSRFRSITLPAEMTHAEGFLLFKAEQLNDYSPKATIWSGKLVENSMKKDTAYLLAVIVRTQGLRQSLLSEALTSIACQSIPCLAVVVVHAGSEMLEPVAAVCKGIAGLSYVIIHADRIEKKRGYPLNLGLQYCLLRDIRFKAVAFLDDDDILYPEFSQKMDQALSDTGTDIICAASNRRIPGQPVEEGYRPISVLNLFVNNFIPINSYVIRVASLTKNPVFFDESLDVLEDWHFLLKLLENGFRLETISDTLSEFRIISDGNKPVKDHPDIWDEAKRRIHAYIQDSLFRMNGRMLQLSVKEEGQKSLQNLEAIRLGEELHKRNVEVETLNASLDSMNHEVQKLGKELHKRNVEVETLNASLDSMNHEVQKLGEELHKRNIEVETLNTILDSRNHEVQKLEEELHKRNVEVETLNTILDSRNHEVQKLGQELHNLNSEIEAMHSVHAALLEETHRERDVANNRIDNLQLENEKMKQELMAAQGAYEELTAVYSNTANEVIALRESKSWKITAPLRRIYGLIMQILRR